MRLNTPLQFAEHLNRALEAGFRTGQKPVTAEMSAGSIAPFTRHEIDVAECRTS